MITIIIKYTPVTRGEGYASDVRVKPQPFFTLYVVFFSAAAVLLLHQLTPISARERLESSRDSTGRALLTNGFDDNTVHMMMMRRADHHMCHVHAGSGVACFGSYLICFKATVKRATQQRAKRAIMIVVLCCFQRERDIEEVRHRIAPRNIMDPVPVWKCCAEYAQRQCGHVIRWRLRIPHKIVHFIFL